MHGVVNISRFANPILSRHFLRKNAQEAAPQVVRRCGFRRCLARRLELRFLSMGNAMINAMINMTSKISTGLSDAFAIVLLAPPRFDAGTSSLGTSVQGGIGQHRRSFG